MKLYLVQHGEAVDKSVDSERPLSESGVKDVETVASVIARAGVAPGCIIHSGKTRARQTAEIFSDRLGTVASVTAVGGVAPLDSVEVFAGGIADLGDEAMVCGHQPFMGKLVSYLLFGSADVPSAEFLPGAAARLDQIKEGEWVLCWFVRPEMFN